MDILKKEIKIDRKVVIMFVIFNFLIMGLYYTYSIFVIRQLKEDVSTINVRTNLITMSSSSLSNNSLTVSANTSKSVAITLTNTGSVTMYYRVMHQGVKTGVAVYETNSDNTSWGSLAAGASVTTSITVNNKTSASQTVTFLLQESKEQYFDKEDGTSYVNVSMNFDHSGANVPVFPSNMIPVYYVPAASATEEGVWKKADVNNSNSSYIWYDYDNFMWANAVTVTETNRTTYLNAAVGTEIPIDDINTFFVWIPKYKYNIVSANGEASYEHLISIDFLNRNDVSQIGSVTCVESISTRENPHLYSEICTDSIYGNVQTKLSTYTHPAFEEDVTGFWMGKFANRNYSNITIKAETYVNNGGSPVENSRVRAMIAYGNAYGFPQNSNATYSSGTWKFNNGNPALNLHSATSMEWGAVAILANSLYGKSGNPMYYTDKLNSFTRIYNNPNHQYTGRSTNYTTSSTSINNTNTTKVPYYDLTNVTHTANSVVYPIGYKGAGASTTGTIYGVYDMSGGNKTTVMGFILDEDGKAPYSVDSSFYTAYSYIPYSGTLNGAESSIYLEVFRYGDGIKEFVRTYAEGGMWQDGTLTLNNTGFMHRGGYTTSGSLFTTHINTELDVYEVFTVLKYNA